jgi:hypothetical protein
VRKGVLVSDTRRTREGNIFTKKKENEKNTAFSQANNSINSQFPNFWKGL